MHSPLQARNSLFRAPGWTFIESLPLTGGWIGVCGSPTVDAVREVLEYRRPLMDHRAGDDIAQFSHQVMLPLYLGFGVGVR